MSIIDRIARILIVALVVILVLTNVIPVTFAIILLILSGIFILTGLSGICPLYMPLRIKTNNKNK